jgi:hypothetical protein
MEELSYVLEVGVCLKHAASLTHSSENSSVHSSEKGSFYYDEYGFKVPPLGSDSLSKMQIFLLRRTWLHLREYERVLCAYRNVEWSASQWNLNQHAVGEQALQLLVTSTTLIPPYSRSSLSLKTKAKSNKATTTLVDDDDGVGGSSSTASSVVVAVNQPLTGPNRTHTPSDIGTTYLQLVNLQQQQQQQQQQDHDDHDQDQVVSGLIESEMNVQNETTTTATATATIKTTTATKNSATAVSSAMSTSAPAGSQSHMLERGRRLLALKSLKRTSSMARMLWSGCIPMSQKEDVYMRCSGKEHASFNA